MKPYYQEAGVTIYHGDCREILSAMQAESISCVVTSPPYYGLRDYGCDAQIGLERAYREYIDKMADVFSDVRRVLRDDGTLWLNIGDSYATGAGAVGNCPGGGEQGERWKGYRGGHGDTDNKGNAVGPMTQMNRMPQPGLKPKDLMGIPWRLAFALQDDGWYLRSDIIWSKPNPMPESVTDRPTKAHEYIFLMSKSECYHYDADAISEPCTAKSFRGSSFTRGKTFAAKTGMSPVGAGDRKQPAARNKRSVWTIPTQGYPEAHFATFPEDLVVPCIKAGCPTGGTVLDLFGGSGTTGLVAKRLGCKAVLVELNERYCELAAKRLSQGVLELQEVPA